MSDAEKIKKTSIGEAERKANLRRQFAERAIQGREGIWWRFLFLFFRFLDIENRSTWGWIWLFIVFMVMFYLFDEILTYFGIIAPIEERDPCRQYRYSDC